MKKYVFLLLALPGLLALSSFLTLVDGYQVGDKAMDFKLKNVDGKFVSMQENQSVKGYILVFTCNTCPFAQAYETRVVALHNQFASKGYPVIAINSNDAGVSPGDSYEKMQKKASEKKYTFPYLQDETQQITQTYGAKNTPTVFVVTRAGNEFTVAYIGAIDNNAQDETKVTEKYVENAVNALLSGNTVTTSRTKAIGCGIKWKKS